MNKFSFAFIQKFNINLKYSIILYFAADSGAVFQYFVILLSPLPFHKNMQYYYFYIVDTAL